MSHKRKNKKRCRRLDCMGLPMTCSNDAALVQYDKALYALTTLDLNMLHCANRALELDHSMVLVSCLLGFTWSSQPKPPTDPAVAPHLEALKTASPHITDREKAHIRAVMAYAHRNIPGAVDEWMEILIHHPRDILAIHLLFVCCIAIGELEKMRDSLARVLPWWTEDMALYPHIFSFYAFALVQNNEFQKAEEMARKVLAMDSSVGWAYHTVCHVIEESLEAQAGVHFLTPTRSMWLNSLLGGHIAWHLALYYLDLGDINSVLKEFDSVLYNRTFFGNPSGLVDAASLLWRLNVMGIDPGEKRWEKVLDGFSKHRIDHTTSWYDVHVLMSLSHGKVGETCARMIIAERMLEALCDNTKTNPSPTDAKIVATLGVPVCTALLAFGKEQYEDVRERGECVTLHVHNVGGLQCACVAWSTLHLQMTLIFSNYRSLCCVAILRLLRLIEHNAQVISLMLPLKYDLVKLGGSWAQRQVFSFTLIHAAIRSNQLPLALALIAELRALKPKSASLAKLFESVKKTYELQLKADG